MQQYDQRTRDYFKRYFGYSLRGNETAWNIWLIVIKSGIVRIVSAIIAAIVLALVAYYVV